jgi:16S rRNA G966 N2-methylase RsmD
VEKDRSAVDLLVQNLAALKLGEQATVLAVDVLRAVSSWPDVLAKGDEPADPSVGLIFCDPPYLMTRQEDQRQRIEALIGELANVTESGGVLMLRSEGGVEPGGAAGWQGPQTHGYGSMVLHFYQRD